MAEHSLSNETHEQRVEKAEFTEADINELKDFIHNMTIGGKYFANKKAKKLNVITGRQARRFWEAN